MRARGFGSSEGRPRGSTRARGFGSSEGRPRGSTRARGFGSSEGRPRGSTRARGFGVGSSGGRPQGTTAEEGFGVGTSGGRPQGTTAEEGFGVGTSGGRPQGTTAEEGFGTSGGRPRGTTREKGFGVGASKGRPSNRELGKHLQFEGSDLPDEWDTSEDVVNLTPDILKRCGGRITQQRRFDKKPLAKALCWQCGRVLWTSVDGAHTFLVDPPLGVSPEQAPATAYLRAMDACSLTFQHTMSGKKRWYSCAQCRSQKVPPHQYVGNVLSDDGDLLPVEEWQMKMPDRLSALRNQYERGQVSLCGLFSTAVKDAGMSQWRHIRGEVNAIHKLDRHFYDMFGFLACKDNSISAYSSNPESSLRIHRALQWLHRHNHLYSSFFSNYETMFRYVKPKFINPLLLEKRMPLQDVLQDEAVAMAFPVDTRYFDQFPLIFDAKDVAGVQHPQPQVSECRETLQQLVTAQYGEKYLEPKTFPHLHPWGHGGWYYQCPVPLAAHVKMRLFDVRGWWATDPCYPFFKYDLMTKLRLRAYNARRVVKVTELTHSLDADKVRQAEGDPYQVYGTDIPRVIPGSK